jgi:hypothetical protein
MLRSVWEKKRKKRGGSNVGHDPMYLCFYDHNFPYENVTYFFIGSMFQTFHRFNVPDISYVTP